MKKIFALVFIYGFAPLFSLGQNCEEPFLGSKTLYTSQQEQYSLPPTGYLPVFMNHVGRHGARHLTKDVNTSYIYQLLLHVDSLNGLSEAGKLLKEKILVLEKVERKNIKSISIRGEIEQQGIAERMFANNKNVFINNKPVLHISYTKEIRTLQTSDAFLAQLKTKINEPAITKQVNDTILRFYDMSPAYTNYKDNGIWHQYLQQLKTSAKYNELSMQVAQQFFTKPYFKYLTQKDVSMFTADLFGFVSILYSIQQEIKDAGFNITDVDLQSFFSCSQLATLDKIDNAEDYFVKGPGTDINDIQVKIALPLLADFIKTTDEYIKTKKVNAQFRFSHAETISPIAALMGLASETTKQPTNIKQFWNADKVIPLSANIQWILYRNSENENYLIKFLLNEKEVTVKGLTTKSFPYYNWNEVRTFYIKKLKSCNANLNTDFVKYLKFVK